MLKRCYQPTSNSYEHYGGRGITVCARWRKSYLNFFRDMGERPAGLILDRKKVNGDYELENCQWATRSESNCNYRKSPMPYNREQTREERIRAVNWLRRWNNPQKERLKKRRHYQKHKEYIKARQRAYRLRKRQEAARCL